MADLAPLYTTIDLLRHGEVQGGACYRGAKDDPLSEKGWQQLTLATNEKEWDFIISSPLSRCADFARTLSPDFVTRDNLKEINFGDWEGKTANEIFQNTPKEITNFMKDPENYPPPNGEKLLDFQARIINEWHKIVAQYKSKHILIISHGGTMRTIISHILNIPANDMTKLDVPYASMSRIRIYHEKSDAHPSLVFHGLHSSEEINNE